jgi:predicted nucleic acid-binding protein
MEAANLRIDFSFAMDRLRSRAGARDKMKSAYELAMERLAKDQPIVTLTDDQKKELAEVDSTFKARIAEKELFLKGEIQKAQLAGKFDEMESLAKQLASDIKRLQEDCETKKEKLRASFIK